MKVNAERYSVSQPAAAKGGVKINVEKKDGATVVSESFDIKNKEKSVSRCEICADPVHVLANLTQLYTALKPAQAK